MDFSLYTISLRGFFKKRYEIYQDGILYYTMKKTSKFGKKSFTIYDHNRLALVKIKQPLSIRNKSFDIFEDNRQIGDVEKTVLKNTFVSHSEFGKHFIDGDFFSSEYSISNEVEEIAKISRNRYVKKGKYGVAILKGQNELYILALVMVIAIVNRKKRRR